MSVALVLGGLMALSGCAKDEDTTDTTSKWDSAANIVQTSDADYDNNTNGIITAATLKTWIDDWATNKPTGITGNLVIMSVSDGGTGREFLASGTGIKSYKVTTSGLVETRSNGVTETPSMVLSGAKMDLFLKLYGIDPSADMIVWVMGSATNGGPAMQAGRGWYLFRYWGVEKEHLALLNGALAVHTTDLPDSYFTATADTAPDTGTFSVKSLSADNTALQASLGEMFDVAQGKNLPSGGAFLWDARSAAEYNGDAAKTTGTTATQGCGTGTNPPCIYVAFEGTIKGAVNLEYTNLLDATAGYAYKSKADISTLVTTLGYTSGETVYTWCRTSYRAMVTMIASNVILGNPAKVYDGAWIEWGQLSTNPDKAGNPVMPSTSPWLTDVAALSDNITKNTSANVEPLAVITNAAAASADAIIVADKAYKN
ncbi:MAG: rhodanese-like domain-containing protein [Nitrospinota bacterium]|nr:rhodanese-like domain-containing protein [Nitrospinota bacterium]